MTDKPTIEERIAQRRQAEDELRVQLAAVNLDGPHKFPTGGGFDPIGSFLGGGARSSYAICLTCGAVVVLEDPEELADGRQVERGVRLHTVWHEETSR